MQIKLANYAIEEILLYFKPNLTFLNEIIYTTATLINPVAITYKQNNFSKWKLRIQKRNR